MTPTAKRLHFARVAAFPCFATGEWPVSLHHPLGGSMLERLGVRGTKKHSDYLVLPLSYRAHQGVDGIHTIGVETWEAKFGSQAEMLDELGRRLGVDLFKLAESDRAESKAGRKSVRPSKILPRAYE